MEQKILESFKKKRGKYTYKTYKWLNGNIDEYRYGDYIEEIGG